MDLAFVGDSSSLYFMFEHMKRFAFLKECDLSKKDIATFIIETTEPVMIVINLIWKFLNKQLADNY